MWHLYHRYEYKLFQELLLEEDIELPEQISFELHYGTWMGQLPWHHRQKTAGEIALLATRLYGAGECMDCAPVDFLPTPSTPILM